MSPDNPAWDAAYRHQGRLWGGAVPLIPDRVPGSYVLDLGCGDGRLLSRMESRGWEVVAADRSPHGVFLARSTNPSFSGTFVIADGLYLPFASGTFDAVLTWHVIGHILSHEREQMAREIERVIRPKGLLSFRGFSCRDMRFGKGTEVETGTFRRGNGIISHYFYREEVIRLFPGFSPERVSEESWTIRIRGKEYLRAELSGTFIRNG